MVRFIWRRIKPLVERLILRIVRQLQADLEDKIRRQETRISRLEGAMPGDAPSLPSEEA